MARRRYISTTISLDKVVNDLATEYGDFVALLWTWMIPHAEDGAYITGDPYELRCMVIPGRNDKRDEDVADALAKLHSAKLIAWDRENAVVYFDSESFYHYQTYVSEKNRTDNSAVFQRLHATPRISGKRRGSAENAEDQRKTPENAASLSLSPSLSPSLKRLSVRKSTTISAPPVDKSSEKAEELLATAWFPGKLIQLAELLAEENKTGKARVSRIIRVLYSPLIALQETLTHEALEYGLDAAITAGAPNANYVKRAAANYRPNGARAPSEDYQRPAWMQAIVDEEMTKP
jgi:hypothetical protein